MRIIAALATACAACAAIAAGAAPMAGATPSASRCVHLGLEPIPVTVRAGAEYIDGTGLPEYEIRWSGRPLPADCDAQRTVGVEVTIWFPHLRFPFWAGLPIPWREFWNGRRAVRGVGEREVSNAGFIGLECPYKARAKLRYEVTAPGGAVLGRRVVPTPVKLLPCPAHIRSKEPPRDN